MPRRTSEAALRSAPAQNARGQGWHAAWQRRRLAQQRRGIDWSVAGGAAGALGDMDAVDEQAWPGSALTRRQRIGRPSANLRRTGSSIAALVQSWEWQLMQA
jgi:hypothetical protein